MEYTPRDIQMCPNYKEFKGTHHAAYSAHTCQNFSAEKAIEI